MRVHNAGFIYYEHHSPQGNKYTTPYEVVFGITAHRENHQNTVADEDIECQEEATELASGKNTVDNDQCETVERAAKRKTIRERQSQYNEEMVK